MTVVSNSKFISWSAVSLALGVCRSLGVAAEPIARHCPQVPPDPCRGRMACHSPKNEAAWPVEPHRAPSQPKKRCGAWVRRSSRFPESGLVAEEYEHACSSCAHPMCSLSVPSPCADLKQSRHRASRKTHLPTGRRYLRLPRPASPNHPRRKKRAQRSSATPRRLRRHASPQHPVFQQIPQAISQDHR